jgi:hypothetical protein
LAAGSIYEEEAASMTEKKKTPGTMVGAGWRRQPTVPADWKSVDASAIHDLVCAITAMGGAIRLGYTRDGGAYAIGLYGLEANPYTEYIRPDEPVDQIIARLAVDIGNR